MLSRFIFLTNEEKAFSSPPLKILMALSLQEKTQVVYGWISEKFLANFKRYK